MTESLTVEELDDLLCTPEPSDARTAKRFVAELRELREQNAALVAALEDIAAHTKSMDKPLFGLHCIARAALASVKGEQG